jgi:hypothetical protein
VVGGDLSKLTPIERVSYYKQVCQSLGLNPLTKPFDYITLNGRLTLYARKDSTDQLRKIHGVSITKLERERIDDVYTVTAYAVDREGRQDSSIGAVNIAGIKGDALANALMKAETKAKRRVTLSLCGLGILDETEIETITDARRVSVAETGEIVTKPDQRAWEKWHELLKEAQDAGLPVIELSEDITLDDLRVAYKELKAGIEAAKNSQK